jgi:hypothetical protein
VAQVWWYEIWVTDSLGKERPHIIGEVSVDPTIKG